VHTSFLSLRINYLAHMLVTHVKFVNLCATSRSTTFQTTLDGQPPDKQTKKTYTWRHTAKWSSFLSSCVSWRPSQTVGDCTLLQIWRHPTTLLIRYSASSSD